MLSSPLESLLNLGKFPLLHLGQLGFPLVLVPCNFLFFLDPSNLVEHFPQFTRSSKFFYTFQVTDDGSVADHDEGVMRDGDGHSVKDGSDGGEVLSAVNWDHGWLSLLSVQGGKYVQEGYRRL